MDNQRQKRTVSTQAPIDFTDVVSLVPDLQQPDTSSHINERNELSVSLHGPTSSQRRRNFFKLKSLSGDCECEQNRTPPPSNSLAQPAVATEPRHPELSTTTSWDSKLVDAEKDMRKQRSSFLGASNGEPSRRNLFSSRSSRNLLVKEVDSMINETSSVRESPRRGHSKPTEMSRAVDIQEDRIATGPKEIRSLPIHLAISKAKSCYFVNTSEDVEAVQSGGPWRKGAFTKEPSRRSLFSSRSKRDLIVTDEDSSSDEYSAVDASRRSLNKPSNVTSQALFGMKAESPDDHYSPASKEDRQSCFKQSEPSRDFLRSRTTHESRPPQQPIRSRRISFQQSRSCRALITSEDDSPEERLAPLLREDRHGGPWRSSGGALTPMSEPAPRHETTSSEMQHRRGAASDQSSGTPVTVPDRRQSLLGTRRYQSQLVLVAAEATGSPRESGIKNLPAYSRASSMPEDKPRRRFSLSDHRSQPVPAMEATLNFPSASSELSDSTTAADPMSSETTKASTTLRAAVLEIASFCLCQATIAAQNQVVRKVRMFSLDVLLHALSLAFGLVCWALSTVIIASGNSMVWLINQALVQQTIIFLYEKANRCKVEPAVANLNALRSDSSSLLAAPRHEPESPKRRLWQKRSKRSD